MRFLHFTLRVFAAAACTLALSAAARAIPRTYVAANGNDAAPCTRISPCETFNGAIAKTDPGGVVTALNSGVFGGSVVITKSVTLDGGEGNAAVISALNIYGVNISAGPTDTVILRNLTVNGYEIGQTGIFFGGNGGQLFLQNVVVERIVGNGLHVFGQNPASPLRVEVNKSSFKGNIVGIQIGGNSQVGVRDSVITGTLHKGGPFSLGINMVPEPGTTASLKIENNEISYCQSGLRAEGQDQGAGIPTWWGRGNHIYGNTFGINMSALVFYHTFPPFSSNYLSENVTPSVGGIFLPAFFL